MKACNLGLMPEVRIEKGALLGEGETNVFEIPEAQHGENGFVICFLGQLLAYKNECPHWSVDLDLGSEHFFDEELERIHCKNHGALFVLPSGLCETGPCLGRSLIRYEVRVDGEDVIVTL